MTDGIAELGIDLAEAMSEATFVNVFGTLDELAGSPTPGSPCDYCIEDLEDWTTAYGGGNESSSNLPDCNCRWTCGHWASVCTHSQCEPTRRGCGFLGLGSCTRRDEIFVGNCP